ncbi:hypothetical protein CIG19_00690 [Enterobacterales bacterium CwR94]|nr:hypothetical protein CIG19_00690 [Enterobacterales bacterium CwR94]
MITLSVSRKGSREMKKKHSILLLLALGILIPSAHATVTCTLNPASPAINTTVALQGGNITAGEDVPNGTILFRQYFKPSRSPSVQCHSTVVPWSFKSNARYIANPKPLSLWNTGSWAGKVYETGIPGLGVAVWYSGNAVPFDRASGSFNAPNASYGTDVQFDMSFIKIGPISPGTIRGQDLPTVAFEFTPQIGTAIRTSTVSFSGTLNVVARTCTTPNPVVALGSWNADLQFKGAGSTSDWRNASINLTNCPRFYGKMDSGQNNYGSDSPTDPGGVGTPQANTLALILRPNTTIIDSAKSIIALQNSPDKATGVGIQIAYNTNASPELAVFNAEKKYIMVNNANTSVSIPLFARYYQTEAKVKPGVANATMMYTINYY